MRIAVTLVLLALLVALGLLGCNRKDPNIGHIDDYKPQVVVVTRIVKERELVPVPVLQTVEVTRIVPKVVETVVVPIDRPVIQTVVKEVPVIVEQTVIATREVYSLERPPGKWEADVFAHYRHTNCGRGLDGRVRKCREHYFPEGVYEVTPYCDYKWREWGISFSMYIDRSHRIEGIALNYENKPFVFEARFVELPTYFMLWHDYVPDGGTIPAGWKMISTGKRCSYKIERVGD